jgi:hypothetical protein
MVRDHPAQDVLIDEGGASPRGVHELRTDNTTEGHRRPPRGADSEKRDAAVERRIVTARSLGASPPCYRPRERNV